MARGRDHKRSGTDARIVVIATEPPSREAPIDDLGVVVLVGSCAGALAAITRNRAGLTGHGAIQKH